MMSYSVSVFDRRSAYKKKLEEMATIVNSRLNVHSMIRIHDGNREFSTFANNIFCERNGKIGRNVLPMLQSHSMA